MKEIDLNPSAAAIRTTKLGILLSIALLVVKALAGYFGHSYALIADATETGTDIVSSVLLWAGLKYSLKPADDDHPYGHGKAEPLAAILISLFLIGAAVWIAYHSIYYIRTPHPLPQAFTLWVLAAVILVKEGMFRYVHEVGRTIKSQAVMADAYHHRSDAITSVAAFIGIVIARLCGQGYEGADDWAALLAAGFIVYNALRILKRSMSEVMDGAPPQDLLEEIKSTAIDVEGVEEVEKCYVRKMGFDYFVDMHIHVSGELTVTQGHHIAHEVKSMLIERNKRIKNAIIHVEPVGDK